MARLLKPFRRTEQEPEAEPDVAFEDDRIDWVSLEEGWELLDEQARAHLNMSAEEFARRYHAGEIEDYEQPEVIKLSYLLSFAEGPRYDRR